VRLKRFEEAMAVFTDWEKWRPDASDWRLFVALAEQGRGNNDKARQAYAQATAWLDAPSKEDPKQSNFARLEWGPRVGIEVLRSEVEQLLFDLDALRREVEARLALSRGPGRLAPILDPLPGGSTMKDQKPGEQWRVSVGGAHLYFETLSPDRRLILSGGDGARPNPPPSSTGFILDVTEATTGKRLYTVHDHVRGTFTPGGDHFVSYGGDGKGFGQTMVLRESGTGREVRRFMGHQAAVRVARVLAGGDRLLSGGEDKTVREWDVKTGKEVRKIDLPEIPQGLSLDGRYAISRGDNGIVRLWDATTGKEVRKLTEGLGAMTCAQFLPSGRIALCDGKDKTLRVLEMDTGKEVVRHALGKDLTDIDPVAVTLDGQWFVSLHQDGTVRVRSLTTGQELHRYSLGFSGNGVAVSPDGRFAVASSFRRSLHLLRLPEAPKE
jgi:hypothetical protein